MTAYRSRDGCVQLLDEDANENKNGHGHGHGHEHEEGHENPWVEVRSKNTRRKGLILK
jgi:hypothetical protein